MRKLTILMTFLLFVGFQAAAQMEITGKVTNSETGEPIPGVSVVVKSNTTIGTATDMDGNYALSGVPSDAETLVYTFVGMQTQEIAINGRTTIDVAMQPSVEEMEEVVVTALGISREKKSLGYSVQDVKSDELTKVPETNMLNSLSGKIAGVQITNSSGAVGSSTRITIRGNKSLGGNSQPLFVVDGTPISNSTSSVSQWGAADFGNAAMDIEPENIESISVLKGANAAAIYGQRARNGVVLITTKEGKQQKGLGVNYSYSADFGKPYILPEYQNKYGQGLNGSEYIAENFFGVNTDNISDYNAYAESSSFAYYNGTGGGVWDYVDESWGPRLDIGLMLPQFDSPWLDASGNVTTNPTQFDRYKTTAWDSHPDNVRNFFQTGVNQKHNLSLSGGNETVTGRLSLSYNDQKGTVPNTDLTKTSVNFSGSANLSDKLSFRVKSSYVKNQSDNIPYNGYSASNVMQSIGGWFGRQVNMISLKENWDTMDPFGKPYTWSYYYHDNPYWTAHKKPTSRIRDRLYGNFQLKYDILDWMTVTARVGTDYYTEKRKKEIWEMSNENKNNGGEFWMSERTLQENNADVMINFDKEITSEIRLDGLVGANYRNRKYNSSSLQANELTVPNLFTISNVSGSPTTGMYESELETNSIYAQVNLSYQDFLFLGGTARNDWSSTLPKDNWSFFYPSVNLGFIPTEIVELGNILSFAKIRGSWAQVGSDTNPYRLSNTFGSSANTFLGTTQYYNSRTLANSDLKPEISSSIEAGLELKFLDNRAGLDFTYYDTKTYDQILAVDIPASSGYTSRVTNAGEIENEGIEISAYGDILKSADGFNWRINVDWSKNTNTVNELAEGLDKYLINSSWGGVTIEAQVDEPLGVIMASGYQRDEDGNILVDGAGEPMGTDAPIKVGNISPDWVGGIRNAFSYKGVNLSFAIDGRKGGDIFSVTKMFGTYAGILDETAEGESRKNGVVAGENVLTDMNFVKADGSTNDITTYAQSFWASFYSIKEESVLDGSFLKLREVSLGYTLPKSLVQRTGFLQSATISLYAHNVALLWTHESNDVPIDPETAFGANLSGQGLEQFQIPPSRTIGFKINTKF